MGEKGNHTKIDDGANDAPGDIGHQQALYSILAVFPRVSAYGFVEVTCFKEKETHKEESPTHQIGPGDTSYLLPAQSTHGNSMVTHHADDAEATQEIKGMITLFHASSGCN